MSIGNDAGGALVVAVDWSEAADDGSQLTSRLLDRTVLEVGTALLVKTPQTSRADAGSARYQITLTVYDNMSVGSPRFTGNVEGIDPFDYRRLGLILELGPAQQLTVRKESLSPNHE